MLKRTKGRLLLTLLVVTGFAGTINDTSLSKKERKLVVGQLKESKTDILKSVKGLSEKQLNFKSSPGQWSIKERIYHLAQAESGFWSILEATMKKPSTPEKRAAIKISDESLIETMVTDKGCTTPFSQSRENWKSINEPISAFKSLRSQQLKYVKTTTEDLRNHFIQLPAGWIDCYQFILFVSHHSQEHLKKIEEIMTDPRFPRK